MDETLGWQTNCAQAETCPRNWLEHSVTEIPVEIGCAVCGQSVVLVPTEADLRTEVAAGRVAAFPTVPCVALPGVAVPMPAPAAAAPERPPNFDAISGAGQWVCQLESGDEIPLRDKTLVVGRSRSCDVVLPSAKVSRQHANIVVDGGVYFMEDLGSANGTWCDGERITRRQIQDGDEYQLSDQKIRFECR